MIRVRVAAVALIATVAAASTARGVTINCNSTSASPGGVATVQIVLGHSADEVVAGTQNDLQFDPTVFSPQVEGCLINPALAATKELSAAVVVVDGVHAVRAFVVGVTDPNVAPIPSGNLYTCPFDIAADAELRTYPLVNTKRGASDPNGNLIIPVTGTDCMVSIVPIPTPTPRCRVDQDCPPGDVCVDGTCVAATPTPTPIGFCNDDHDCPTGEVCVDHHCVTRTPTPIGYCTSDEDCPSGEVCVNNHCVTPTPTPQCRQDADCPNGQVCVNGMCTTPTPKKGGGSSGCNCEIAPGAPASQTSAVLALLLPACVVVLRWRSRRPSR